MVQKKDLVGADKAEGKRRGRPRAYAPDVAIGQALSLFRRTGYAATSLDDLSAATGMNRPSLYGAFGDKRPSISRAIIAIAMTTPLEPSIFSMPISTSASD